MDMYVFSDTKMDIKIRFSRQTDVLYGFYTQNYP